MILRLFFGPSSARQAALKGPQLPEMFWVPQGRGWDAFPNSQGSLLGIAPMQALDPKVTFLKPVPRLSALDFIYSFIYYANFIKKQLFFFFLKRDFRGGAEDKNPPADAGDMGSIPAVGTFRMPQSI